MVDKKKTEKTEKKEKKVKKKTDTDTVRFRDWFKLTGIRAEIKNISWLTKKELAKNSAIVLLFCFVLGLFFFGGDAVIAFILKALGMD